MASRKTKEERIIITQLVYEKLNNIDKSKEIWQAIDNYSNYIISNFGRVQNINTKYYPIQNIGIYGYPTIHIYNGIFDKKNNFGKQVYIHRLLAQTFIPNPLNLPQVHHKNAITWDYDLDNLEWTTARKNSEHTRTRERHKITIEELNYMYHEDYIKQHLTLLQVCKKYSISDKSLYELFRYMIPEF